MKTFIFHVLLLLLCGSSLAQFKEINRTELEDNKDIFIRGCLTDPINNQITVLTIKEPNKKEYENTEILYDSNLLAIDSIKYIIPKDFYQGYSFYRDNVSYELYFKKNGDFNLLTIDERSKKVTSTFGKFPIKCDFDLKANHGDFVYLTARLKKYPVLFQLNLKTLKSKPIPIIVQTSNSKKIDFKSFIHVQNSSELILTTSVPNENKRNICYLTSFNIDGEFSEIKPFHYNDTLELLVKKIIKNNDNEYLFWGTYRPDYKHTFQGIYTCKMVNNQIKEFNKYLYDAIESDFDSLMVNSTQKEKERLVHKDAVKITGYYNTFHDLIQVESGYYLIYENYYATDRRERYTFYNSLGEPEVRYRYVFDGNQFTNAFVHKFDLNGKLDWSQKFKLDLSSKKWSSNPNVEVLDVSNKGLTLGFVDAYINLQKIDQNGIITYYKISDWLENPFEEEDRLSKNSGSFNLWNEKYILYSRIVKSINDNAFKKADKTLTISKLEFKL